MRISDWSSDVCSSDLQPGADGKSLERLQSRDHRTLTARLRRESRRAPAGPIEPERAPCREGRSEEKADRPARVALEKRPRGECCENGGALEKVYRQPRGHRRRRRPKGAIGRAHG